MVVHTTFSPSGGNMWGNMRWEHACPRRKPENHAEHASEHGWEHAGSAIVPHQLRNRGNMQKASLGCTYIHRMLILGCTMVMVVEGLYIVVQTIVIEIKLSWLVGDNLLMVTVGTDMGFEYDPTIHGYLWGLDGTV